MVLQLRDKMLRPEPATMKDGLPRGQTSWTVPAWQAIPDVIIRGVTTRQTGWL